MNISYNWLKEYLDFDLEPEEVAAALTSIGLETGGVEEVQTIKGGLEGLVIGEVLTCEEHPNSDHLHICKVNVGEQVLPIVCGAPNVRKGLKVIVALPGANLPGGITIKAGKIRGEESNGMLCSMAELGLESKFLSPEDKEGIHELPQEAPVGEDPIKYLKMDDEIIDFELTANRGDLLSVLGMAHEVAAIYNKKVKNIDLQYDENNRNITDEFNIKVETENCSMLLVKKVENVTIKESPEFIKNRLIASGIRPINNVVDISNYVMLETGQPLHFYDADTLKGRLEVRMAKNGEKLTTLDGIERILSEENIVISDGEKAIGLAGVMGGLETEVTTNTKNIIIESAIFNPVKIRMTSKEILRSEASNRFEKGLDPNRTYMAIERSCNLLQKYAGAEIVGGLEKYDTTDLSNKKIEITYNNINSLLGSDISKKDVLDIFERLGFGYEEKEEKIIVEVPRRRIDVNIKEDLIEEVGRIYGVNNIKGKLPMTPTKLGSYDKTKRQIRNKLIDLGLNETLSYVLVNEKEANDFTTDNPEVVKLLAPMTEERNALRHSIIPSLLKIYEYNKSHYNKDVCIFEIGKTFYKKDEEYGEENKIAGLMTGNYYLGIEKKQVDFYIIKGIVEELLDYLGYGNRYSFVIKENLPKELHPGQSALISVNNDIVGIIGKIHPQKVKENVYVFEINLEKLLAKKVGKMKYKEISKYPSIKKDLAIITNKEVEAQEIATLIKKSAGSLLLNTEVFDVYTGKGIEENKKSIAYSLEFGANDRTLTDEEINNILEKIIANLTKNGAEIRK